MKKILFILFLICLALTGCSSNETAPVNDNPNDVNPEVVEPVDVQEPEVSPDYVIVDLGPAVKITYDDKLVVDGFNYMNGEAETLWKDVSLDGKDIYSGIESLLQATPSESITSDTPSFIISDTDDVVKKEILNKANDYSKQFNLSPLYVYSESENGRVLEGEVSYQADYPSGIYVSYEAISDGYHTYEASTLVFGEDHKGYCVVHKGYGAFCVATTFTWTDDGDITLRTDGTGLSYIHNSSAKFRLEDGVLVSDFNFFKAGTERKFEHVDSLDYACVPNSQIPPHRNPAPNYSSFDYDYNEITSALNS